MYCPKCTYKLVKSGTHETEWNCIHCSGIFRIMFIRSPDIVVPVVNDLMIAIDKSISALETNPVTGDRSAYAVLKTIRDKYKKK